MRVSFRSVLLASGFTVVLVVFPSAVHLAAQIWPGPLSNDRPAVRLFVATPPFRPGDPDEEIHGRVHRQPVSAKLGHRETVSDGRRGDAGLHLLTQLQLRTEPASRKWLTNATSCELPALARPPLRVPAVNAAGSKWLPR